MPTEQKMTSRFKLWLDAVILSHCIGARILLSSS